MQAKNGWVIATIIICAAIVLVSVLYANTGKVTQEDIDAALTDVVDKIPAAADVSVQVEKDPQIAYIYEEIFEDEFEDLEDECLDELYDEFKDDLIDELEDLLGDVHSVSVVNYNYDDEYDFTAEDLGLDDEGTKSGYLSVYFRVRYRNDFGEEGHTYAKVLVSASCSDYDTDDNEFDNLSVDYSLA